MFAKIDIFGYMNAQSIFCTKCGTKTTDDSNFCYKCGNKLIGNTDTEKEPEIKDILIESSDKLIQLNSLIKEQKTKLFSINSKEVLSLLNELCTDKQSSIRVINDYYLIFQDDLIEDLKSIDSSYDGIKKNLSVFIQHKIIKENYPHERITDESKSVAEPIPVTEKTHEKINTKKPSNKWIYVFLIIGIIVIRQVACNTDKEIPQISQYAIDESISIIKEYKQVKDAGITQKEDKLSLVVIMSYGTTVAYAKNIGDNFVRLIKSYNEIEEGPHKEIGEGVFEYAIFVVDPNEKDIASGIKLASQKDIIWWD